MSIFESEYIKYLRKELSNEDFDKYILLLDKDNFRCARINTLKEYNNINFLNNKKEFEFENAYYINSESSIGNTIYHELGLLYIQEPSAMLPVKVLDPKPGEKILDLCSAPGSKATQIAKHLQNKGVLVCNEINRARAQVLNENIIRLGIRNAIVTNMHPKNMEEIFDSYFDAILVDAPCSGEGMFRKFPENINKWTLKEVQSCSIRQAEILNSAIRMLKPNGRIVYSTCTLNNIENEKNAYSLLENENIKPNEFNLKNIYKSHNGMLKLSPLNFDGEGQFIFSFTVNKDDNKRKINDNFRYKLRKINKEELKYFTEFTDRLNIMGFKPNYIFNNIFMEIPDISIDILSKLNIINAGVRLGEVKRNGFIPTFSFARAVNKIDENTINLSLSKDETIRYISGDTINYNNENEGFVLLSYNGLSISWGKIKNGIIKNYYPKNIRKLLAD